MDLRHEHFVSNKQKLKGWRSAFTLSVFQRDKSKCRICDEPAVDAHHITDRKEMPNDGYAVSNGISLCEKHHWHAEAFHISKGASWEPNMHPDDLYKIIGSSKEKAIDDSKKLK